MENKLFFQITLHRGLRPLKDRNLLEEIRNSLGIEKNHDFDSGKLLLNLEFSPLKN